MSTPPPPKTVCRRCRAALDADDNYCRRCGTPTANVPDPPSGGATSPIVATRGFFSFGSGPGWWESPWVVLPMLFLILGPLGLPLLWGSRRFNLVWKVVLTLLVIGETVFVVQRLYLVVTQSLDAVEKTLSVVR